MAQAQSQVQYKSPLFKMTQTTPTCLWNDSAAIEELTYSIEHGAVGATCNPSIAVSVLKQEMPIWKPRILELGAEHPRRRKTKFLEIVEEISANAAKLLKPIFDRENGRNGRLSIQTDPRNYRNSDAMLTQAIRFSRLAPNMIVKIAATRAGIVAMEEATYRGISINATVSFTLPQAIAVAEAVERGLKRREAEGLDISTMGPVCTMMVGRLDDWLKVLHDKTESVGRSRLFGVGRRCRLQKGVQDLSRARIPDAAALGGVPQSHALERVHRRRCGHFSAMLLAKALQRERYRSHLADRYASGREDRGHAA